jgi:hypothetical protein
MTEAISSTSINSLRRPVPSHLVRLIDRWIFVFSTSLIVVIALIGFIPDSLDMLAAVRAHVVPGLPPVLHVHAVLMGSWLLLLLTQSVLVAIGRTAFHRQLGLISVIFVPAIVLAGIVLVPTMYRLVWNVVHNAPPALAAQLKDQVPLAGNILLGQIRVGIVFPLLVSLALLSRGSDSETHKRLMILATLAPLPAAIDRMHWLPNTFPASPIADDFYPLLVILPLILWDLFRLRRVPRAYWIWLCVNAPFAVGVNLLWNDPRWLAFVPKLMGVA